MSVEEKMDFRSLTEMVQLARKNLAPGEWDYLVGAADTESSLRRNRAAVDSWVFKPRILNDVSAVDVASELLGSPMRIPVVLPPIGSVQAFDAGGGISVARAAKDFGILQILSSACAPDYEAVAQGVPGPEFTSFISSGMTLGWTIILNAPWLQAIPAFVLPQIPKSIPGASGM